MTWQNPKEKREAPLVRPPSLPGVCSMSAISTRDEDERFPPFTATEIWTRAAVLHAHARGCVRAPLFTGD